MTKAIALPGAIPAKLSLNMRPNTAAGFAKDAEAVNQQAAPIWAAAICAAQPAGARTITSSMPAVATATAIH